MFHCTCGDDTMLKDDSDDVESTLLMNPLMRVCPGWSTRCLPSQRSCWDQPPLPGWEWRWLLWAWRWRWSWTDVWKFTWSLVKLPYLAQMKYWPQLVGGNPSYITWNTSLKLFSELEAKNGVRWRTSLQLKPEDGLLKEPCFVDTCRWRWPCITNHFLCQHLFLNPTENCYILLSIKYLKEPINLNCIFKGGFAYQLLIHI